MDYLKSMRRRKTRQLLNLHKRKRFQEEDLYLCYTDSGFLTDILEYNGFAVHSLERCSPNYREFRLVVEIKADEKLFKARVVKNLERLNSLNFKP